MTIQEVSKRLNINSSAIRYYEKEGILPRLKRQSGIRLFTETDVMILHVVICLKKTGMSIIEIRKFMELYVMGDDTIEERVTIFNNHERNIQLQIDELNDNLATLKRKMILFNKTNSNDN